MSPSITLLVIMAVLFGAGMYMMLERSITRILIGFLLVGNGANLLILLMSGRPGRAPIMLDGILVEEISDPLPQALILTAIVINLGIIAFMLALVYRSWWLSKLGAEGDEVVDEDLDVEEALESDVLFEQSERDDEAIQMVLDSSDEGDKIAEIHPETGPITIFSDYYDRQEEPGEGEGEDVAEGSTETESKHESDLRDSDNSDRGDK
ncbi:MAG: Na(+)/H(+) antiporter subunit C [Microbacteriaceae bacterium]